MEALCYESLSLSLSVSLHTHTHTHTHTDTDTHTHTGNHSGDNFGEDRRPSPNDLVCAVCV